MVQIRMSDCFNDRLIPIAGAFFGMSGSSSDGRVSVCISSTPSRCPTSECANIRKGEKHTFSTGHVVTNMGWISMPSDVYKTDKVANIMVIPPSYISTPVNGYLPELPDIRTIPVYINIPNEDGVTMTRVTRNVGLPTVEIPGVVPSIPKKFIPSISKTITMINLPSSVFTGDVTSIIGTVDVDGEPISNEPVNMYVGGELVAETVTRNGLFEISYIFDRGGGNRIKIESPSTDAYPDSGVFSRKVMVSSATGEMKERIRAEQEQYEKARTELAKQRVSIPDTAQFESIFRRDALLSDTFNLPSVPYLSDVPDVPNTPDIPDVLPGRGGIVISPPNVAGIPAFPDGTSIEVYLDSTLAGNIRNSLPLSLSNIKVGIHSILLKTQGFSAGPFEIDVKDGEISILSGVVFVV